MGSKTAFQSGGKDRLSLLSSLSSTFFDFVLLLFFFFFLSKLRSSLGFLSLSFDAAVSVFGAMVDEPKAAVAVEETTALLPAVAEEDASALIILF